MKLETAFALCKTLTSFIGGRKLDDGQHEVNETVTLHVQGIVTKEKDSEQKTSLPTRQAIAYLLDKDKEFERTFYKALEHAWNVKDENAKDKEINMIKRGMARLEIVESTLADAYAIEKTPKAGATKVVAEMDELESLTAAGSPFASLVPR